MELEDSKKLLAGYHGENRTHMMTMDNIDHLVVTARLPKTHKDSPREVQMIREAAEALAMPIVIPRPLEIHSHGRPVVYSQLTENSKANLKTAGVEFTPETRARTNRAR